MLLNSMTIIKQKTCVKSLNWFSPWSQQRIWSGQGHQSPTDVSQSWLTISSHWFRSLQLLKALITTYSWSQTHPPSPMVSPKGQSSDPTLFTIYILPPWLCQQPAQNSISSRWLLCSEKLYLSLSDGEKLVHAFVSTRVDDCNELLIGINILQNDAALSEWQWVNVITPICKWLPILLRIQNKAFQGSAPIYLKDLIPPQPTSRHPCSSKFPAALEDQATNHGRHLSLMVFGMLSLTTWGHHSPRTLLKQPFLDADWEAPIINCISTYTFTFNIIGKNINCMTIKIPTLLLLLLWVCKKHLCLLMQLYNSHLWLFTRKPQNKEATKKRKIFVQKKQMQN